MAPYLRTANMMTHAFWDSFYLGNQASTGGGILNSTTYAFGLKMVFEEIHVLKRKTDRQQFFGFNCYDHCIIENPWWWELTAMTAPDSDVQTKHAYASDAGDAAVTVDATKTKKEW